MPRCLPGKISENVAIFFSLLEFLCFPPCPVPQGKYKLDKFWSNQDIIFDYKAELTGIGKVGVLLIILIDNIHVA